jgi:hypothetical protein
MLAVMIVPRGNSLDFQRQERGVMEEPSEEES